MIISMNDVKQVINKLIIINKFSLAEDKFMPEMHFKHPGFTYSACGPFTLKKKKKETIRKFK